MGQNEYVFKLIWQNKLSGNISETEFSTYCDDRQIAHERAFEEAMKIHKNMCMKDKNFSNKWYYAGIELITVIPNYWKGAYDA